jgi:4-alpha-glucanotransferase
VNVVAEALQALGIERLLLGVHDACFPLDPDGDAGQGSPYSAAGRGFLRFAAELGFTGVQFGPQGRTSPVNASPYDGTLFAKSILAVAPGPLALDDRWQGLLPPKALAALAVSRPPHAERRADPARAWRVQPALLRTAFAQFTQRFPPDSPLARAFADFQREHAEWLSWDSQFQALAVHHGTLDWRRWPDPDNRLWSPRLGEEAIVAQRRDAIAAQHAGEMAFAAFGQFLVHAQHASLRQELNGLGLKLYGDLQVGVSHADLWRYEGLFLSNYRMGAPPSRTNPDGQPWGYPVLDPAGYASPTVEYADRSGAHFMRARVLKMLQEFDGLRVDHPHGLIHPWVYRADDPHPLHAVQRGARLFAAPDLPDHPDLARYAIARREDLAPSPHHPRYADDWVRQLSDEQVVQHGALFSILVDTLVAKGGRVEDIACEVLSTCPLPLAAVLARHGLGRFRVVQKADPANRRDPYRTATAAPPDWVMLGTHDTPPIWNVFDQWKTSSFIAEWAHYLAERLEPLPERQVTLATRLARDPVQFRQAYFADLFLGPARNVSIFFPDLLGMKDIYNRPGVVHPENWTLRVPPDYAPLYRARCAAGQALDLAGALALALRARSGSPSPHEGLIAALERESHGAGRG